MRIFAVSDLHVDYPENMKWLVNLSESDYKNDILILAGDVTDLLPELEKVFRQLVRRFKTVLFVPGNHDLWVHRCKSETSLHKFKRIQALAADCRIRMSPFISGELTIIPLYGWYDYTFGMPSAELYSRWADYSTCLWPDGFSDIDINQYFLSLNERYLDIRNKMVITFSHFLPRSDLVPRYVPHSVKILLPVMGTSLLEKQIRQLNPGIHIYGHSHLNRKMSRKDIVYLNNAFGYPHEWRITAKELLCVYEV